MARSDISRWPACCPQSSDRQVSAGYSAYAQWLVDQAKLDGAIDYKPQDLPSKLSEEFPEGVDLFFDNVGGTILEQVIPKMALHGTVVMCGSISGYNESNPPSRSQHPISGDFMPAHLKGVHVLRPSGDHHEGDRGPLAVDRK